ncbi:uncharacterized protein TRAVEDRAFT_43835 [Trametes versicolor FP-101664 SS1]|uniref:uncharacterized protein n=1 Tax=Trametes versicolor (strain FP-101664) TaxID=717944 RepID=UPI000462220A|nr:uncharacterized protein TRAVEDRAFT_43835 [Trametes versicolor FP-101664 SS1]EIW63549.1 hypothetical protein TRAVEDRAFT_43835 [Trametes versicolor FP-101664 SS1]
MATLQNATGTPLSDTQGALPAIPALDNSYGAMLLGTFLGIMLYGLTIHQTYRYFRLYSRDPRPLKLFVLLIVTLETLHTVIWMIACYHFLITDYFKPSAITAGQWTDKVNVILTNTASLVCQCFYARRVYLLHTKTRWVVALASVSMLATFGFGISGCVKAFELSLVDFPRFSWLISGAYGCALATDTLLTGALIHVLLHSRTGFKSTDSLIDTLILYSINTGLLTGITGLLTFVFALILPGNYIYAGLSIVNLKLYANSVLAILNSRRSLVSSASMVDDFELCPASGASSSTEQSPVPIVTWKSPQWAVPSSQVSTSLWQSTVGSGAVPTSHESESGREFPLGLGEKDDKKRTLTMETSSPV